jgi:hypothetical protein
MQLVFIVNYNLALLFFCFVKKKLVRFIPKHSTLNSGIFRIAIGTNSVELFAANDWKPFQSCLGLWSFCVLYHKTFLQIISYAVFITP